ncbi:MAG: PqqD family protein [Thermodesulfobacteriota bacterium]
MKFEKHVKVRQEKFGAVVFETLREKVFVTNETGSEILRFLEEGKELEDVIAGLANNYSCDPKIIEGDVNEFIWSLKDSGIIEEEEQK